MNKATIDKIKRQVDILCYGKSAINALIELDLMLANPHTPEAHTVILAKRDQIQHELDSYAKRWSEASKSGQDVIDKERWENCTLSELLSLRDHGSYGQRLIANRYLALYGV